MQEKFTKANKIHGNEGMIKSVTTTKKLNYKEISVQQIKKLNAKKKEKKTVKLLELAA